VEYLNAGELLQSRRTSDSDGAAAAGSSSSSGSSSSNLGEAATAAGHGESARPANPQWKSQSRLQIPA